MLFKHLKNNKQLIIFFNVLNTSMLCVAQKLRINKAERRANMRWEREEVTLKMKKYVKYEDKKKKKMLVGVMLYYNKFKIHCNTRLVIIILMNAPAALSIRNPN